MPPNFRRWTCQHPSLFLWLSTRSTSKWWWQRGGYRFRNQWRPWSQQRLKGRQCSIHRKQQQLGCTCSSTWPLSPLSDLRSSAPGPSAVSQRLLSWILKRRSKFWRRMRRKTIRRWCRWRRELGLSRCRKDSEVDWCSKPSHQLEPSARPCHSLTTYQGSPQSGFLWTYGPESEWRSKCWTRKRFARWLGCLRCRTV